jgi:hypothetical protein
MIAILTWYNISGADNAIEITVVLPNATVVTANKDSYPDLFW